MASGIENGIIPNIILDALQVERDGEAERRDDSDQYKFEAHRPHQVMHHDRECVFADEVDDAAFANIGCQNLADAQPEQDAERAQQEWQYRPREDEILWEAP